MYTKPKTYTDAKYLIFLDIDGVFTSNRVEYTEEFRGLLWSKFDPIAVNFMNRIADKFDKVEFVLISTWRDRVLIDNSHTSLWIETTFRNAGFRGNFARPYWKVNPFEDSELYRLERAYEIKDYLENYAPGCKDYLIFDDNDYDFNEILGKKRLVKTHCYDGLLFKHMEKAWSIAGQWDYE